MILINITKKAIILIKIEISQKKSRILFIFEDKNFILLCSIFS